MPYWLEVVCWFVGLNWGLTLLFWVYPLVMWLVFKDFVFDGWHGPFAKFRLATKEDTDDPIEPWHAKAWRGWWGVGLHWYMCYRYPHKRGELHEGGNCWQQLACGMLWWVIHFVNMGWIVVTQKIRRWWILRKLFKDGYVVSKPKPLGEYKPATAKLLETWPYTKHAYLDSMWERMARKRAGQLVDVPPEQWMHGKDDIWPWW